MFQTFNDTLYIEFIKHTFLEHHSKRNRTYSQKKKVILYNTFNIHENVTLMFLILIFFSLKFFKLCSFNDQKHIYILKKDYDGQLK
jgi:hypothetical protein